ncbi:TPA: hypothetical protein N0F65_003206 [Lagenidium giganteum]|uniref:Kazal-like domain-containing protein n=1 Tax=Lagenidium giganteum TaxID=4803 RepID=A0AAV2ZCU3_9STRA|nr:TPA: hypothetical protein N0F65_003206 [Lagenidium giganteum]
MVVMVTKAQVPDAEDSDIIGKTNEGVTGTSEGASSSSSTKCKPVFSREIRYVCGSDGQQYTNPSIFAYHQCVAKEQGKELEQVDMKFCEKEDL